MKFSNVHTHTVFSDGKNTIEEMILGALDRNFLSYGVSDHSETQCDLSYCMKKPQYPEYIAQINNLKEKYKGKIDVLCGMELDYFSEINRKFFDYIISSVHYLIKNNKVYAIDHAKQIQIDCINECFNGDQNEFAKAYFDQCVKNVKINKPTIVGHIDVITKYGVINENDKTYREIALAAVDKILEHCDVIEVNTGAIFRKCKSTPYPNPFILERILQKGGNVVINGDSHCVEALDTYFTESVDILKSVGFNKYLVLKSNGFDRVKI